MKQDRVDRRLGPILLLLAILWSWMVVDTLPAAQETEEAGPRAFPLMTVNAWRHHADAEGTSPAVARVTGREARIVAYGFLMEKIGFLLATPLIVCLALGGILGIRAWRINAAMALGLTAAYFLIFIVAMEALLPRGIWIQIY